MKKPTKKLRFVKKELHPLNEQQMRFLLGGDDNCTYGDCTNDTCGCTNDCTNGALTCDCTNDTCNCTLAC